MKCSYCDTELTENELTCPNCGKSVNENEAPVAEENESNSAEVVAQENPGKKLGIVAMILGIASVALFLIGFLGCCCTYGISILITGVIALAAAVVALVLSIKAKSKSKAAGQKNAFAIVGLICSLCSIVFVVVVSVVILVLLLIYGAAIFTELAALFALEGMY
ncbi:MAG: hypothetical protein IJW70_07380 [Clostridia bacterium]|nr:hypothetical protein [Clostridia bacterium]